VGVEGVIDKDFSSSLLATRIRAEKLIIGTTVDQVAVQFGKPGQRWLGTLSREEAAKFLAEGEFPPGSMGPKIEAGIDFVAQGGEECIITSTENVSGATIGEGGTHIVASWSRTSMSFPQAPA
jgi:carbamate kinase